MQLTIVHPDRKYGAATLTPPTTLGYLHLAAEVQPRRLSYLPAGQEKSHLLQILKDQAQRLEQLDAVERATVFDALAIAPPSTYVKELGDAAPIAHFDVVVLIETTTPATARELQAAPQYQALVETLRSHATKLHIIAARNVKRIADVDRGGKGLFLFNYFVGDDPQVTLALWDYLAGWYEVETGLATSVLLAPLDGEQSDYRLINYAQWNSGLLQVLWHQLTKPSFRSYMLANLSANRVGAMPIIYRLA